MLLSDFDFALPKNLIAQVPQFPRGSSRLLCLDVDNRITDKKFADILDFLMPGDVLVFNDTKVISALLKIFCFQCAHYSG